MPTVPITYPDGRVLYEDAAKLLAIHLKSGNLEVARELLQIRGIELDTPPEGLKMPPLFYVREKNTEAAVRLLMQHGADLEAKYNDVDGEEVTPLMYAARKGYAGLVAVLLNCGSKIDAVSSSGKTALMFAVDAGELKCCEYLLQKGANVDVIDHEGYSPLVCAVTYGYVKCCEMLLKHGAKDKGRALKIAAMSEKGTVCLPVLLRHGADVNANDGEPLFAASHFGKLDCLRKLIAHGADVNLRDRTSLRAPVFAAASQGHTECLRELIQAGADVDNADINGVTALMAAAYSGHAECVKLLLDAKCDKNKLDKEGRGADEYAIEGGNGQCMTLLKKAEMTPCPAKEERQGSRKQQARGFDAIAGMKKLKEKLQTEVIECLRNPEKYERFNISIPNGLLLYGAPGCGKTYFAEKFAEETGWHFIKVTSSDIASTLVHGTEKKIREVFDKAIENAPCVLYFDELNSMVPCRDSSEGSSNGRGAEVNEFLSQLDNIGKKNVFVIGSTNHPKQIDPAVLRAGRLEIHVEVTPPDLEAREALFAMYLKDRPLAQDVRFERLAVLSENFNSAKIKRVCDEAARYCIRHDVAEISMRIVEERIMEEKSHTMIIGGKGDARKGFECVAGMRQLKERMQNDVIACLKDPSEYSKAGLHIPNGMLLYGPPGCGKTFFARKFAEELGFRFIEVTQAQLASTYIHGTEEKIGNVFDEAEQNAPCVLYFDEINSMVPSREKLDGSAENYKQSEVNAFLSRLDNIGGKNVFVVASTNFPDMIDSAVLRPGRIEMSVFVPPPDEDARAELFRLALKDKPVSGDIDCGLLAAKSENYTCAELRHVIDEAARYCLGNRMKKRQPDSITQDLILIILRECPPKLTPEEILKYCRKDAADAMSLQSKLDALYNGID